MSGARRATPGGETPTITDVARRAGVSTATVSRTLNRPEAVRPELRRRVVEAINELGYVPIGPARALARRRTDMFGAIAPTIENTLFGRLVQALQDRIAADGVTLLLASSNHDAAQEARQIDAFVQHGVDGLMLTGDDRDEAAYRTLIRRGIPYVNILINQGASAHPVIGFDNRAAIAQAVNHLADLGHRRFAMASGPLASSDRAQARLAGAREALRKRGLGFVAETSSRFSVENGRKALVNLMATPEPPTAIVCANDILAFGVMAGAADLGLKVPDDISVTGFDDIELAEVTRPGLTTIHVPAVEIGRQVGEFLLARRESKEPPISPAPLSAPLVVRGSTAPPRRT